MQNVKPTTTTKPMVPVKKSHSRYQPVIEQQHRGGAPRLFGVVVNSEGSCPLDEFGDDDSLIGFDSVDEAVHELLDELLRLSSVESIPAAGDSSCSSQETVSLAPIDTYRRGIVSVSDISRQMWCEQQLAYSFMYPYIEDEDGNIVRVDDQAHMRAGTELHEQRELEVHDIRELKCANREQAYAVRLLNMIVSFDRLKELMRARKAGVVREVPIFGLLFSDVPLYFRGIIDEIGYDPKVGPGLSVVEFKTRSRAGLPSNSQMLTHKVQVANPSLILQIQPEKSLEEGECDEELHKLLTKYKCFNLNELFNLTIAKAKTLPVTKYGWIEYMYQCDEKREVNKSSHIDFNVMVLHKLLGNYAQYWNGDRDCSGVDIEEVWKCNRCAYIEICEWRNRKSSEHLSRKRKLI